MKRSALFIALWLAATVSAVAGPKNQSSITTKAGKTYFDCKVTRIYPDGIGFTHRDGAAKVAFKDLPENLRQEYRYDPRQEREYQREQAARREEEKKRAKLQEIVMEEKLAEAQMAEASYLAAASEVARRPAPMSTALPGEQTTTVSYQTPSWVGAPITGTPLGGSGYRRSGFSGYFPYLGGYSRGFYPYGGGYYPSYYGGYPYGGYGYGYYSPVGAYSPTFFRSWNLGGGFRVGLGVTPFCNPVWWHP